MQPIKGGSAEQFVGEGRTPFIEVQIAGDDGGGALITLGDEFMEILVLGVSASVAVRNRR